MAVAADSHRDSLIPEHTNTYAQQPFPKGNEMICVYSFVKGIIAQQSAFGKGIS